MATITLFRMDFDGWSDPEGEELRDFSIYNLYEGNKFHLHYGVKTSVEFILPPGKSEIFCAVRDEIGAITEIFVDTVEASLPDRETLETWKSNVSVEFFTVEGKMSIMAQAIASEAIVEERERENNYVSMASEVDRVWKEYWEWTGIDSSYYTKEAREEIEAMLRDQRSEGNEKEAQKNFEMLQSLEVLPFEVMEDSEVYGLAVSALAETKPLNKDSKHLLTQFIEEMADSNLNFEAAHPEDKKISNGVLANVMNSLSKSISEEMIGGKFLDSELEEAYEVFKYNITEPNFFILYVNGSRWEVEERVRMTKVEGAKNVSQGEVRDQTELMKNITERMKMSIAEDLMVGEDPLVVESTSGFQLKVEKRHVDEVSGETIENEGTSITLPNSCVLLGKPKDCRATREAESETESIGLVVVKWSGILETEGTEDVSLSAESNTLDFSLTNRAGNSTLKLRDTPEPFEVCMGMSQSSGESAGSGLRHVAPSFGGKDDFLVYHQLTIDESGAAVKVEFAPDEKSSPFVFFYGVGYKPSLLVYDGRVFVADLQTEGGAYSMLFGSSAEEGDDFYFAVGHLTESSAKKLKTFQKGKNLTRDDMTNEYSAGYSIALYTTGCYFFSEETSSWSSEGCKVHSSHSNMVCCHCNHLTMFGSGFLIAPNKIDFSYVFANAGFEDNLIIYLTLIISFSLYVILAIWSRWKDKKDLTKLGATPLPDNDTQDKYFYEILVQTGYQFNAGTKSKVHFIISGEDDETDVRVLADDQRPILQRGSINCFIMSVPRCLGQLNYLRIWHDNSGEGKNASWYLKHIVVKDIITGYKYEFIGERWFAVEEGDGLIDHLIPVAGKEQMTEFSHLFPNASRRSLTDNHLWLSVFTRPPRSRFTRLQRLSCCLSILYLSMLTSAMWYETTPEQPSPGAFKFGPLSLSPEQIAVGMLSNLIVFPPSFVMIVLFRKSRARELRPSHVNVALEKQYEKWRRTYGLSLGRNVSKKTVPEVHRSRPSVDEEAHSGKLLKKKCLLPWWCAYVSWFLVIVSVGSSVFFLWAYGLQFGNIRTGKWLTSMVISFLSSVLLTEPLKIFLIAIIMACLCGNPDVDDDDSDDDEQDPYLKEDEEWLHSDNSSSIVQRPKYRPIDPRSLEAARKLREKEVRMYSVLKEIGAYVLFLWILFILSYGNRDPNSFYLREATINNFIKPGDLWVDFNNVNNEVKFWNWTRTALIPELFAGLWYNGRPPLGLRLLIDDRNNFKIGYPVLRQIRARTNSCTVPEVMTDIISECAGYGNLVNENGAIYSKFWSTNLTMASKIPPEYKYLTASDLNGFPFWGQLDWYGGGGYVVPLVAKRYEDGAKLIEQMEELEQTGWINKDTRAVFVEFGTYNAQVNLFVVATIVAEFLPGGGIIPYYHIDPIRLLHYHTGSGLLQLVCQIGFVLFTLYYTVLMLRGFCREGGKYFSQYWNIAEMWNVLASWAVIGVEIYKMIITQRILAIFTATEGTGYIKLQEALILDEAFCYLIGFLMSLATLKFLKLLRFNKRIGGMIATVRLCAKELKGYGVCLIITFLAFVSLFWLTLGRAVKEFCSFASSFESSISMLLKKFNYYDMEQASSIIGPLAFFTFALTASVVLINILLTIIIQSFEEVKHGIESQTSDYELMDFIMRRLRLFFGRSKDHSRVVPITFATTANKKNDVMDSFNGKVDRLLDFINSVYLDEQVDLEFLNKARSQIPLQTASQEQLERKKSRPRKIPRYQPLHVKKHLDF
ncbi:unnamed protein product [Larinioides sclopetarius]|uniref:Polycystic kidney disease protein 1-like 2 n=1 Tax=Larinioides sclopetarius TaxID=280406 RepID=A0AAV2BYD7_9ARAC